MERPPAARLLYAASETDADILYPTGFFAPDPFLFVQKGRTRMLVMSDLEMDRARKQARVDRVLSWSKIAAPVEKDGRKAKPSEVIALALRQQKVLRQFHRFSIHVWGLWMVALVSGFVGVMLGQR